MVSLKGFQRLFFEFSLKVGVAGETQVTSAA